MKFSNILLIIAGATLELLSILTLLTNPDSLLPELEIGFVIPVVFASANIQAIIMFIVGTTLTFYAFNQLKTISNSQDRLFPKFS